jgi:hypothetical protein
MSKRTNSKSKSKSPRRSQKSNILKGDELDDILENITLKRPRNPYTYFCIEEVDKFKKRTKVKKLTSRPSQKNVQTNGKNWVKKI